MLPRLSPTGLFGLFILISFLACTLLGGVVIAYRTQQTIIEQQRLASQHELKFAASFIELFLQETLDDLKSVAASPIVINNVMDGGESIENLKDLVAHREDENLTFLDLNLDVIYSNKRRDYSSILRNREKVLNAILDGEQDSHIFLAEFDGSIALAFAIPVTYQGSVEGMLLADLTAVASKLFPEFAENHNTLELIGEQQSFAALEIESRDDWLWLARPLSFSNLTLRFGLSSEPLRAQQHATIKSMLVSILVAFVLSFALVYWVGRKILLNPYRELEASRQLLAENAKRLEASEREARQLAQVAEHANDMVIISDVEGLAVWANQAFTRTTGFELDELIGRKPGVLLQGRETDGETILDIGRRLARRERVQTEILNYTKTGDPYWVDIDIVPVFDDKDEFTNFIAIERDITERMALTDNLKAALADAEQAAKAKAQFLAMMSHEIRTPMNGVLGTLGLLVETPMSDDQKMLTETARESGEFLLAILNDILDFSKLEAGKLQLENIPFSVDHIVKGAIELCQAQAADKGLSIDVVANPDLPDLVRGDPGRIRQMLLNYLSNAIKFTERGRVTLTIDGQPAQQERVYLRFSVRDTGMGIPEDKIHQLFGDFNQVDGSISRRFGGTGLGLAITRHLAESMGGRVWLESTLGEGSTFYFEAPFELAEDQTAARPVLRKKLDHKLVRQGLRILVAEDNRTNLLVAQKMLGRLGCTVDVAANGIEAVEAASQRPYDIILMDMQMPEMDGLAATREIRANAEIPGDLPIIALTANAMAGDKEQCLQAGMNGFVSKPIKKVALIAEINTCFAAKTGEQAA